MPEYVEGRCDSYLRAYRSKIKILVHAISLELKFVYFKRNEHIDTI